MSQGTSKPADSSQPNPLVHQSVLGSRCWRVCWGLALGSLAPTPGLSGSRLMSPKSPRRHAHWPTPGWVPQSL